MAQQGGRLVPVCVTRSGGSLEKGKTLWANADQLSSVQRQSFADAIIAPNVTNVASVSLVQADKDGNPFPPLLLILNEREEGNKNKNITLTTVYKALSKVFENEFVVDPESFPIGYIEQLKNWWPDEQDINLQVLAGTYTKPTLGRKKKQTASAGQSVSSAHTASSDRSRGRPREQTASAESDDSPPRKRNKGGSIRLTVKKQPTARRKRPRVLDTSEEEDDITATEDPAVKGCRPDDGSRTEVCTHACCLAASVMMQHSSQ